MKSLNENVNLNTLKTFDQYPKNHWARLCSSVRYLKMRTEMILQVKAVHDSIIAIYDVPPVQTTLDHELQVSLLVFEAFAGPERLRYLLEKHPLALIPALLAVLNQREDWVEEDGQIDQVEYFAGVMLHLNIVEQTIYSVEDPGQHVVDMEKAVNNIRTTLAAMDFSEEDNRETITRIENIIDDMTDDLIAQGDFVAQPTAQAA